MNTKRALSFLASAPLLLAAGCAVSGDESSPEDVGVAQQAATADVGDVFEGLGRAVFCDAASAVGAGSLGGFFLDLIFPPEAGDGEELTELFDSLASGISASVRSDFLMEYNAKVNAAADAISVWTIAWNTSPTGPDTENFRKHVLTTVPTTLNEAIHLVDGSVAPGAPQDVKDAADALKQSGFFLYIAAAQIDITRLQLLMRVDLAQGRFDDFKAKRNVLLARLAEHVGYVRAELNQRASQDMASALNTIGPCSVYCNYDSTQSGIYEFYPDPYNDGRCRAEFGFIGTIRTPQASSFDLAARECWSTRDFYVDEQQRATSKAIAAKYGFATRMADVWARTLDAWNAKLTSADRTFVNGLIGSPGKDLPAAGQTTRKLPLEFGGMWGMGDSGSTAYPNPIASNAGACPAGFERHDVLGTYGWDYPAIACTRTLQPGVTPAVDFGGMWGETVKPKCDASGCNGTTTWPNPITGAASCPSGYTQTQVLGLAVDHRLFYCWRPHSPTVRSPWLFGGAFSYSSAVSGLFSQVSYQALHPNPVTGGANCPVGYSSATVFGSGSGPSDQLAAFCYKPSDDADFGLPSTRVRLKHEASGQCVYHEEGTGAVKHWGCWDDPGMEYYLDTVAVNASGVATQVRLRHAMTDTCIYGVNQDGAAVLSAPCSEDPKFVFQPVRLGNNRVRLSSPNNRCLYAEGGNGGATKNWGCWADPGMVYVLEPVEAPPAKVRLRHAADNQCLYNQNGVVRHWGCWADPGMEYYLDPVAVDANGQPTSVRLRHALTDTCITSGPNGGVASAACWEDPGMVFKLTNVGGGQHWLASERSGQCVFTSGGDGGWTYTYGCWDDPGFRFYLDPAQ